MAIRARYDEEPSHSDQVANLALQIFDGLRKVRSTSTPIGTANFLNQCGAIA